MLIYLYFLFPRLVTVFLSRSYIPPHDYNQRRGGLHGSFRIQTQDCTSVRTSMVSWFHSSIFVVFTEVGCATLVAGRKEFCLVCEGWCSLNRSTRPHSHHCHKQSIFHEEKHLQQIWDKDKFSRNRLGSRNLSRKWPPNTSDYYYWIITDRCSIEHPQADIALILKWIPGKPWCCMCTTVLQIGNGVYSVNQM